MRNSDSGTRVRRTRLLTGVILFLILTLAVFLIFKEWNHWKTTLLELLRWLERQGIQGALWILCLQAILVVLTLPGPFFTAGAGFLFGVVWGEIVAVGGSTLGAVIAYGLARIFTRGKAFGEARFPRLRQLEQFADEGGWEIVLATRLFPLFPFKLSNYFFGWMRFPFWKFFWGTFFGIIPITFVSVAAGSLASDLSALLRSDLAVSPSQRLWSFVVFAAAMLFSLWIGYRTQRKLRATLSHHGPR